jgi:hypothetical protein
MDFRMTDKTIEEQAREAAQFQLAAERERKLELLRRGELPFNEAEKLTFEECAKGDAERQKRHLELLREERQRGARLRAGITK